MSPEEIAQRNERYEELLSHIYEHEYGDYIHVDMEQYFRLVFERQGQLRLQERGKDHYHDGHYNAIIKKISRGGRESHLWWIVTDTMAGIRQYERVRFAIVAPVTYIGKTRSLFARKDDKNGKEVVDHTGLGNARYLFAITVDLDNVSPSTVKYLHKEIELNLLPDPSFIVTSGSGLHLYYCFERPIKITRKNMNLLNRLKHTLTRCIWRYNATSRQRKVEIHDINQGYRFPGTQTKTGRIVHGFNRHYEQPLYHTPSSLNEYVKRWYKNRPEIFGEDRPISDASSKFLDGNIRLSTKESKELDQDLRLPAHWSLATAREKFGEEWYKQIQEKGSVDWKNYSENFYESWLERLRFGASVQVGHRYWCLWILAAWAWNCKIPYARLQKDAYELIEQFDSIPNDDQQHVPFTIRDCNAALSIYREKKNMAGEWKPIRLSRAKTVRITGLNIEAAKRNYRSKTEHLRMMREQYNTLHDERRGGDGEETRGRKSKEHLIRQWQEEHPGSNNKSQCARELQIDIKTVRRWWVEAKNPIPQEASTIAQLVMQSDEKYDQQTPDEIQRAGRDLARAIDHSAISPENIARLAGMTEEQAKAFGQQFKAVAQNPAFWQMMKMMLPNGIPPEMVPPGAREALDSVIQQREREGEIP